MGREMQYSGKNSVGLWRRINAIRGEKGTVLYGMGCMLQQMEHGLSNAENTLLRNLEAAEKEQASKTK